MKLWGGGQFMVLGVRGFKFQDLELWVFDLWVFGFLYLNLSIIWYLEPLIERVLTFPYCRLARVRDTIYLYLGVIL